MMTNSVSTARTVRTCALLVAAAALVAMGAGNAQAQFRGGGPRMAPEKQAAAWELEAKGVAHQLSLSAEETGKLVAAYQEARKSQGEAMTKLREESSGGGGFGGFEAFRELSDSERSKLETALKGFLSDEQVATAIVPLGTFNGEWDRMADALIGFALADDKLNSALKHVQVYVVANAKAREEAIANMDFQSMRGASQELKGKLDGELASILSEEQLAKWTEATTRRGGRGGRGGGGGRRGQ